MSKEIDHRYTQEVVCPYCGWEHSESCGLEDDSGHMECEDCEKYFTYERNYIVSYHTSKSCEQNGEQHQWGEPIEPFLFNDKYISSKHCGICGECKLVPVDQTTRKVLPEEV